MESEARGIDAASASFWARELGLGTSTFREIPVGGMFRFRTGDTMRKTSRMGWYVNTSNGRKFRTGAATACFPVADRG